MLRNGIPKWNELLGWPSPHWGDSSHLSTNLEFPGGVRRVARAMPCSLASSRRRGRPGAAVRRGEKKAPRRVPPAIRAAPMKAARRAASRLGPPGRGSPGPPSRPRSPGHPARNEWYDSHGMGMRPGLSHAEAIGSIVSGDLVELEVTDEGGNLEGLVIAEVVRRAFDCKSGLPLLHVTPLASNHAITREWMHSNLAWPNTIHLCEGPAGGIDISAVDRPVQLVERWRVRSRASVTEHWAAVVHEPRQRPSALAPAASGTRQVFHQWASAKTRRRGMPAKAASAFWDNPGLPPVFRGPGNLSGDSGKVRRAAARRRGRSHGPPVKAAMKTAPHRAPPAVRAAPRKASVSRRAPLARAAPASMRPPPAPMRARPARRAASRFAPQDRGSPARTLRSRSPGPPVKGEWYDAGRPGLSYAEASGVIVSGDLIELEVTGVGGAPQGLVIAEVRATWLDRKFGLPLLFITPLAANRDIIREWMHPNLSSPNAIHLCEGPAAAIDVSAEDRLVQLVERWRLRSRASITEDWAVFDHEPWRGRGALVPAASARVPGEPRTGRGRPADRRRPGNDEEGSERRRRCGHGTTPPTSSPPREPAMAEVEDLRRPLGGEPQRAASPPPLHRAERREAPALHPPPAGPGRFPPAPLGASPGGRKGQRGQDELDAGDARLRGVDRRCGKLRLVRTRGLKAQKPCPFVRLPHAVLRPKPPCCTVQLTERKREIMAERALRPGCGEDRGATACMNRERALDIARIRERTPEIAGEGTHQGRTRPRSEPRRGRRLADANRSFACHRGTASPRGPPPARPKGAARSPRRGDSSPRPASVSVSPGKLHITRASPGGSRGTTGEHQDRPANRSDAARFLCPQAGQRRGLLRPPRGRSPVFRSRAGVRAGHTLLLPARFLDTRRGGRVTWTPRDGAPDSDCVLQ